MTTYHSIYCHYPVSKIIYSNDSFTLTFTGYLKEQLALFNSDPLKLENKKVCLQFNQNYNTTISDEDWYAAARVYIKMKRLRAMYLQLTFYFKQFNAILEMNRINFDMSLLPEINRKEHKKKTGTTVKQ